MNTRYILGELSVELKKIPVVSSTYGTMDFLGALMVRWGINRNKYRVAPGLYACGKPDKSSNVFVSANYKLSFDHLRRSLKGINGWILVLDTKGVNVWCAAGKGTFGTKELINRIQKTELLSIVNHRRIILPQLGAPGVAAHEIKTATGFNVIYGPVRSSDIKEFVNSEYRATKEMRKVTFNLADRLKLIPNDLIYGRNYFFAALAVVFLISFIPVSEFSWYDSAIKGAWSALNIFLAYLTGIVLTPALLPVLPFRQFSYKGLTAGIILTGILYFSGMTGENAAENISWLMMLPAVSSFTAMNFTGSSTYTSLSGVRKEMKTAVPVQIIMAAVGVILHIISKFIK